MKKLIAAAISASVTFGTAFSSLSAKAADIRFKVPQGDIIGYVGDVNGSGKVDVADLLLLSSYITGRKQLEDDMRERSDLDEDGLVDGFDLTLLRQYLLGEIPPDPIRIPIVMKKGTAIREKELMPFTICIHRAFRELP